jgi:ribose 5-phosphate isomerase B
MKKRIFHIGADSAGYELKEILMTHLRELGYECHDHGTYSSESCHYPIFASAVCKEVQKAPCETFGLLVCGTGIGMSMCANKYNGVRAALCADTFSARMTRMHNDANVICMGARVTGSALAIDILDSFLGADFEGGRHAVRVDMISDIEKEN